MTFLSRSEASGEREGGDRLYMSMLEGPKSQPVCVCVCVLRFLEFFSK